MDEEDTTYNDYTEHIVIIVGIILKKVLKTSDHLRNEVFNNHTNRQNCIYLQCDSLAKTGGCNLGMSSGNPDPR